MLQLEPGGLDVRQRVDGGGRTWRARAVPRAKWVQPLNLVTWSTAKVGLASHGDRRRGGLVAVLEGSHGDRRRGERRWRSEQRG